MGSSFRLILQSGTGAGTEYPLDKTEMFLGRDMSNDLVVNDSEVSRRHARLVLQGNTYSIEDLGSTNGTFIRGQRIGAPVVLKPGELVTIGEQVILRFEVVNTDPNATVASPRGPSQQTQPPAAPRVSPAAPVYVPPPAAAPVIPPTPVVAPAYAAPVSPKKKMAGWLIALLIVVAILVVFCLIPWIIIEATNSYCSLFPGIFNSLQPGVCP